MVAHNSGFHIGQRCGAGLLLDGVLLDASYLQISGSNRTAVVIDTVAAQVLHGHIVCHELAAVGLEAVLLRVLNGDVAQFHIAAHIQLYSGGTDVNDGAVVYVQLAAEGVNAVLFAGGAFDGYIVHGTRPMWRR